MKVILSIISIFVSLSQAHARDISSGGDDTHMPTVAGYIEAIGTNVDLNSRSKIIISIIDSTLMDDSSTTVLEQVISGVKSLSYSLYFALDTGESLDTTHSYSVQVHVDVNGDGKVSRGDLINTQSYPISGVQQPMFINLEAVKF